MTDADFRHPIREVRSAVNLAAGELLGAVPHRLMIHAKGLHHAHEGEVLVAEDDRKQSDLAGQRRLYVVDRFRREGVQRFTEYCPDFECTRGAAAVVEPRDDVKGDLARSILYMSITYDLPLRGMGPMLTRWHNDDPPDDVERCRNDRIEELQGTRNGFINSPEAVWLPTLAFKKRCWDRLALA